REIVKKGVKSFEAYVGHREAKTNHFAYSRFYDPKTKEVKTFYSPEEENAARQKVMADRPDLKFWEDDGSLADREQAELWITRFKSRNQLEAASKELETLGF